MVLLSHVSENLEKSLESSSLVAGAEGEITMVRQTPMETVRLTMLINHLQPLVKEAV